MHTIIIIILFDPFSSIRLEVLTQVCIAIANAEQCLPQSYYALYVLCMIVQA